MIAAKSLTGSDDWLPPSLSSFRAVLQKMMLPICIQYEPVRSGSTRTFPSLTIKRCCLDPVWCGRTAAWFALCVVRPALLRRRFVVTLRARSILQHCLSQYNWHACYSVRITPFSESKASSSCNLREERTPRKHCHPAYCTPRFHDSHHEVVCFSILRLHLAQSLAVSARRYR